MREHLVAPIAIVVARRAIAGIRRRTLRRSIPPRASDQVPALGLLAALVSTGLEQHAGFRKIKARTHAPPAGRRTGSADQRPTRDLLDEQP
ncbi:MAG: hypothetical protein ACO38P_06535, partial [Phycisphaerales bacterium]